MCGDCLGTCLAGCVMTVAGCCYSHHKGELEAPSNKPVDPLPPRPVDRNRITKPSTSNAKLWRALPNAGADYEVDPVVLRHLQERFARPSQRRTQPGMLRPMSLPKQKLYDALSARLESALSDQQKAAQQRLQNAFASIGQKLDKPDLMIKIVPDLDVLLFDDVLSDRITVSWTGLALKKGKLVKGMCAWTPSTAVCKAYIQLNKALCTFGSKWEVLGTLVHELLHAYFLVMGSSWGSKKGEHEWFPTLAEKIVGRLGMEGFEAKHITE